MVFLNRFTWSYTQSTDSFYRTAVLNNYKSVQKLAVGDNSNSGESRKQHRGKNINNLSLTINNYKSKYLKTD